MWEFIEFKKMWRVATDEEVTHGRRWLVHQVNIITVHSVYQTYSFLTRTSIFLIEHRKINVNVRIETMIIINLFAIQRYFQSFALKELYTCKVNGDFILHKLWFEIINIAHINCEIQIRRERCRDAQVISLHSNLQFIYVYYKIFNVHIITHDILFATFKFEILQFTILQ